MPLNKICHVSEKSQMIDESKSLKNVFSFTVSKLSS